MMSSPGPLPSVASLIDRLDWNLLRTFMVIMQEQSISRGASKLHLTQPAVSLALKRLEDSLGAQLILRHGVSFEPTRMGEEVWQIARDIYGQMWRLETAIGDTGEDVVGSVHVLVTSRVESSVFDEYLADFHRSYPRAIVHLEMMRSSDIVAAIQNKTGSVGFGVLRTHPPKLEQRLFLRQRYAIFCGKHHRLFGSQGLSIDDLLEEDLVSFSSELLGGVLSTLNIFREQHGFVGRTVATSPNLDEVRRLIFAGYGIGFLPEHIVRDDLLAQRLWRLPPQEGVADVNVHLLWNPTRKRNAAERAFLDGMERTIQRYSLADRLTRT